MFNIDLHIHTQRYSPCAEFMDPQTLAVIMQLRGLHGVLITEHNAVWTSTELKRLQQQLGQMKVYRGCEVSTAEGHMIVVGIRTMHGIKRGMRIKQLVELVANRGGSTILVHPYRASGETDALDFSNLPQQISAVEVMSSTTIGPAESMARSIAKQYGWPVVAGSDAHALDQVGVVHTSFDRMPRNESELAQAIRSGKGCPKRLPKSSLIKLNPSPY